MRYVVIFKAPIQQLDAKYSLIAKQLRAKALNCFVLLINTVR
jgi:hypothetical protein